MRSYNSWFNIDHYQNPDRSGHSMMKPLQFVFCTHFLDARCQIFQKKWYIIFLPSSSFIRLIYNIFVEHWTRRRILYAIIFLIILAMNRKMTRTLLTCVCTAWVHIGPFARIFDLFIIIVSTHLIMYYSGNWRLGRGSNRSRPFFFLPFLPFCVANRFSLLFGTNVNAHMHTKKWSRRKKKKKEDSKNCHSTDRKKFQNE